MMDVLLKMKKHLMSLNITNNYNVASSNTVAMIENHIGTKLPSGYSWFLSDFGTLSYDDNLDMVFQLNDQDDRFDFINFYGLQDGLFNIKTAIDSYDGRISDDVIPIAECAGGDQICIGVSSESFGTVYHWNHEHELSDVSALSLLSGSFSDFILNISLIQDMGDPVDDSAIEYVNISDKFLSRLNRRKHQL